jgi:hypothetical protein
MKLVFNIYKGSQLRVVLSLGGDFELGLLNKVGTVKCWGLLKLENACCTMSFFGARGGMLWFKYEMSLIGSCSQT